MLYLYGIIKFFGSVRSPVNANLRLSVCLSVCLFGQSLSRALNLHLKAVLVSPRSVLGQTQVRLRSDSGQTQVSLRSVSGQTQVRLRSDSGQS